MPDSPVRIAFCITELDPGGAERALVRIVTALDRSRWEPHVYCLAERGPLADELEAADTPLTCLNVRSKRDVGVVRRLARLLTTFGPQILQTFMFHGNIAGRLAARWANVPVVVAGVRVVEPDARWRMRIDRWTHRLVDHTVCVSRGVAGRYRALGYREEELTVVPNGVDVDRFADAQPRDLLEFGIPADAMTILSVGRLHPQKGQTDLITAFSLLIKIGAAHNNAHLLLVGDGPDRESIAAEIRRQGLGDRVHFAGWQPDTAPLMKSADLFVLASRWEGMPNVLLEAMAAGLPCVSTDVEGVTELIRDGETGLLAPPSDPHALAIRIDRLINDPALASQIATHGQKHVRDQFTWKKTIQGFEVVWDGVLRRESIDDAASMGRRNVERRLH